MAVLVLFPALCEQHHAAELGQELEARCLSRCLGIFHLGLLAVVLAGLEGAVADRSRRRCRRPRLRRLWGPRVPRHTLQFILAGGLRWRGTRCASRGFCTA
jgi:hypothetical protein